MAADFKDHFSRGSADYAAHRPSYPMALVDFLAGLRLERNHALDCGCGTGQLSVPLAQRFDRVTATDASASQISQAMAHEKVSYRIAPAEDSGLPDGGVDLVTVAQAAHWLDLDAFYREVRRVAKPDAVVALITYGVVHIDDPEADRIIQHFYHEVIGPFWPPERRLVEEGYRSLPFPFREIPAPALAMEVEWSLPEVLGYVETWSAVGAARRTVSGAAAIPAFQMDLGKAWGDPETRRRVSWPLSLRVGRV